MYRWGESFFRQLIKTPDFTQEKVSKIGDKHGTLATKKRKNLTYEHHEPLHSEDANMIPEAENHPILFEHIYLRETKENVSDNTELDSSIFEPDYTPYK